MEDDVTLVSVKDSCLKNSVRMGGIGALVGKLVVLLCGGPGPCH